MNIYFSCSITGGRSDEEVYQLLVAEMLRQGHTVPTAHLSSNKVMELETVVDANEIYKRAMGWLEESDAVVAEVSTPSHGVGYEIAVGLALKKPVFCCYRKGRRVSKILTGNDSPTLTLREYTDNGEAIALMNEFLTGAAQGPNCK
jgi:nucleoside 2-deoxyribosyltransferase